MNQRSNKLQLQEFIPQTIYKNTGIPPTTGKLGKELCEYK